jgi:Tol biopolymer transport system component
MLHSRDGRRVAYCGDAGAAFQLWTMLPDGTEQAQLTLGGRAPSWQATGVAAGG